MSVKVLHKIRDITLGQCAFISVNFCARKPPVDIITCLMCKVISCPKRMNVLLVCPDLMKRQRDGPCQVSDNPTAFWIHRTNPSHSSILVPQPVNKVPGYHYIISNEISTYCIYIITCFRIFIPDTRLTHWYNSVTFSGQT